MTLRTAPVMTTVKRKKQRSEILYRYGRITGWRADAYVSPEQLREGVAQRESQMYLDLKGTLTEPLSGTERFSVMVFISNEPRLRDGVVASVGSIIRLKPTLQAGLDLSFREFQTLMQLAAAEKLRSCRLAFQVPYRGHALIVRASFSSAEPDENEG